MDTPEGRFDTRYVAFLETISQIRPKLHRYCARMIGSVADGEDVVQEALFQAYRNLDSLESDRPLAPWLFRIAHNRCIDVLRRRQVRKNAESAAHEMMPEVVPPADPMGPALGRAVEHLVMRLPPKERACVLLKDVFDYSLEEIAEHVESTVGGVKAALNRGRSKLAESHRETAEPHALRSRVEPAVAQLLQLYVERFNRQDWNGVRDLISADARLLVADQFAGPLSESPYFTIYERMAPHWRLAVGEVEGQPAVIHLRQHAEGWAPASLVRLDVVDARIARIADYWHCPWVLQAASSVRIAPLS
jgi:RNA polymerase sigma-70 factor, ECF subfamily